MKTILVSKTGMSFATREQARLGSATGEQGETEGILRHLVQRGDVHVIYFGRMRGEVPGVTNIAPDTQGLNEHVLCAEQEERWARDIAALKPHEPIACINVTGPPATFSWARNPRGAQIQAQGVHYTGPILNAIHKLGLKRICVNNDPRTYPRDQEMSYGWTSCRPVALLDQCAAIKSQTVGGKEYRRVSVYSAAQSWAWLPEAAPRAFADRVPCNVVAHAHIGDGCAQQDRDSAWRAIIDGDYPIYGKGWEHYTGTLGKVMGPVKPSEALQLFHNARCTPCVAAVPGFYTGKAWVAYSQGCIPVPFGDGQHPHTWDPVGRYVGLDNDYERCTHGLKPFAAMGEDEYCTRLLNWGERLKPDWSMLDKVVDKLIGGCFVDFEFGGYCPC